MKVTLIAAVGQRNELGKNGDLIWRVPGDLARAKDITMGHPVIMGRKTYESFPEKYRPLGGRTNIVLSRSPIDDENKYDNVYHAESVSEALAIAKQSEGSDLCCVFGGAEIYKLFLPYADILDLTMIDARDARADTHFPRWDKSDFQEVMRESITDHDPSYHFVKFEKKK